MRLICVRISLAVIILVLTASPMPVRADVAPPEQTPGSSIDPASQTKVQMVTERVEFDLQTLQFGYDGSELSGYVAVEAEFIMLNRGLADETLQVRFPLDPYNYMGAPKIENFRAFVNGVEAPITTVEEAFLDCPIQDCPLVSWATFAATFPVQQQIVIRVTYNLIPMRVSSSFGTFNYILETGAGWYGVIGSATFVLRLPYKASPENAIGRWAADPTPEYRYNEIRWYAESIEPTSRLNLGFSVIFPNTWRRVLGAQAKVNSAPTNADYWAELGEAYAAASQRFHGRSDRKQLQQAIQAYVQSANLSPTVAETQARLAELRWQLALGHDEACYSTSPTLDYDVRPVLPTLSLALALDESNARAQDLYSEIKACLGKDVALPVPNPRIMALVATPTPTPKP